MKIVVSSGLQNEALKVKNQIENINYKLNNLETIISSIDKIWDGSDAREFVTKYQSLIEEMKSKIKDFNNYYEYLNLIYKIFQNLEVAYYEKVKKL